MSRRRLSFLLLFLPLFALACCRTAGGQGSGDWKIKVEVSNKGSKSEGRHHLLLYKGKALPAVFDELVSLGGFWRYETRPQLWGDSGYLSVEAKGMDAQVRARIDAAMTILVDAQALASSEKEAGFYLDVQRRPGTPDAWFWARRGDLSAFIDPKKVDAFLQAHPLAPLPATALETLVPARE